MGLARGVVGTCSWREWVCGELCMQRRLLSKSEKVQRRESRDGESPEIKKKS